MTEVSQNLRFATSKRTDGRQGTVPLQKPSASNTDCKPSPSPLASLLTKSMPQKCKT